MNLIEPQNSHIDALPQAVMPLHTSRVNTVNCRFVPTILKKVMKFQTLAWPPTVVFKSAGKDRNLICLSQYEDSWC